MTRIIVLPAMALAVCAASAAAQQDPADAKRKVPSVRCLTFSPDGKSLAVAHAGNNSLVVWDVATRRRTFVISESSDVSSVAYSPHGDVLAIGTGSVVKLLDPSTGGSRRELNDQRNSVTVRSLAFTPDGKQLATAGTDRTVKIWDLTSGEVLRTLADFEGNVVGVAISPDGKWLATSCGTDDAVKLWELEQPEQPRHQFRLREGYVPQIVFSPDSRLLAIPNYGGTVPVFDVVSGEEFVQFTDVGSSYCAAFSPDGKWLAVANQHLPIDLLPFDQSASDEQRRQIARLIEQFQDDDYATRETASKQLAAVGIAALPQLRANLDSQSAELRIRCRRLVQRLQNAEFAVKLAGHSGQPNWVAFSTDSKLLASGDRQGTVKLWDVAAAKEVATLDHD